MVGLDEAFWFETYEGYPGFLERFYLVHVVFGYFYFLAA